MMAKQAIKALVGLSVVLILSACTLGGKAVPLSVIEPQLGPVDAAGLAAVGWSVQVPRPITDQTRDSDRLMVRRDGARLQVYPGVVADSVPEMLQTLLVRALIDGEKFAGVEVRGPARPRAGGGLRFELVDDVDGQRVELVVSANLIHQRSVQSVGSRTFRTSVASKPPASKRPSPHLNQR